LIVVGLSMTLAMMAEALNRPGFAGGSNS
jgi:hypothetical protein